MGDLGLVPLFVLVLGAVLAVTVATVAVLLVHRQRTTKREHDLHLDLQEQRLDIERREHRLGEREERLDSEVRALEERAQRLDEAQAELDVRRADLLDLEDARRRELERVAGLTVEEARAQVVEIDRERRQANRRDPGP